MSLNKEDNFMVALLAWVRPILYWQYNVSDRHTGLILAQFTFQINQIPSHRQKIFTKEDIYSNQEGLARGRREISQCKPPRKSPRNHAVSILSQLIDKKCHKNEK